MLLRSGAAHVNRRGRRATSYLLAGGRRALLLQAAPVHQVAGVESEALGLVEHHRGSGVAARVFGVHVLRSDSVLLRRTATRAAVSRCARFRWLAAT